MSGKFTVYGLPGVYNASPITIVDGGGSALAVDSHGKIIVSSESSISFDEVESVFDHGRNSDVDTSAEQITTTSITATRGVLVKAANANTGRIFVGNSDVTADSSDATDGFELGAGESLLVKVDNANRVYVIASVNNQIVYWFVV